jgi:tetratricopeptide (TPR) repeat protein
MSAEPQPSFSPGLLVAGRYEILDVLGEGGMGAVYKVHDVELERIIALKVIRPELAGDPKALQRFKQELILARQITHRNVVRIFDLGSHGSTRFITMEFVQGRDLSKVLEESSLPPAEAARLMRQVCRALEGAHGENVIHRDLKPQNIMIEGTGRVLVMDFGLARSIAASGLTRTGTVLGSPAYMSPEQAKGMPLDQRSDIFSFGAIFYECLTGQQPYQADTVWAMLLKRMQEPAPAVRSLAPDAPEELNRIVAKCLESDPERRYQTATEVALDLDLWLDDTPLSKILADHRAAASTAMEAPSQPAVSSGPRRFSRLPLWVAAFCAVLVASAGVVVAWRLFRTRAVAPLTPQTVVLADIGNHTGDAVFDGTLEPVLRLALEGAGFITAYTRSTLPARLEPSNATFNEAAATRYAVSQGLGLVVAGSLDRRGSSYELSARVVRAITGATVSDLKLTAGTKAEVLPAVGKLGAQIRSALGDDTSENAQRFAMDAVTATSLEAVHEYAAGMIFLSSGLFEGAREHFRKSTEIDPKFGLGWAGMASASRSLGDERQAEKYIQVAYANIDSMTERERYRTRGLYFVLTGDQQKCVEEYSALIEKYPSDVGAHNNLGVCYSYLRNISKATQEMQKAAEILPGRAVYRFNLALYRVYAGDFDQAEKDVRAGQQLNGSYAKGYLTLAYAQLGAGQLQEARMTYEALSSLGPRPASLAKSGIADLAIYQGRFGEAEKLLEAGAQEDLAAKRTDNAADKFNALAYALLSADRKPAAAAAAEQALAASNSVKTRFLAGRTIAAAGESGTARKLATSLASELKPEPQSYGKLIAAAVALREGNANGAVSLAGQAVALFDTWIARFDLGRAYLAAGAYPQGDAEFDRCLKRRGEAMELFMDDAPTFSYFPPVYYYLGQVRAAMKVAPAEQFGKYLAIREQAGEDPHLREVQLQLGR